MTEKNKIERMSQEELDRRDPIGALRWWWLSFADGERPPGSQWLGVAIVQGRNLREAIQEAWRRGANPGGECLPVPYEDANAHLLPGEEFRNRLLTKADMDKLDADPVKRTRRGIEPRDA